MEEKLFRNRVAWMMFLLSILVIWVHSYNVELFAGKAPGVSFDQAAGLETFLSVTVGQIAVPGFFRKDFPRAMAERRAAARPAAVKRRWNGE